MNVASVDIVITTKAESFDVIAGENFTSIISVDVRISYDADYYSFSSYSLSLDIDGPEWLTLSGDNLFRDVPLNSKDFLLTLSGTPVHSADVVPVKISALVVISGDLQLEASCDKDITITTRNELIAISVDITGDSSLTILSSADSEYFTQFTARVTGYYSDGTTREMTEASVTFSASGLPQYVVLSDGKIYVQHSPSGLEAGSYSCTITAAASFEGKTAEASMPFSLTIERSVVIPNAISPRVVPESITAEIITGNLFMINGYSEKLEGSYIIHKSDGTILEEKANESWSASNLPEGVTVTSDGVINTALSIVPGEYTISLNLSVKYGDLSSNVSKDVKLALDYRIYNITYNLNGGSVSGNPISYVITDTFTLNNPERKGYYFVGWTGTGLSEPTQNVTIPEGTSGDISYDAVWEEEVAFAGHSIILDGKMQIAFYMNLPNIDGVNYADKNTCYMKFTSFAGSKKQEATVYNEEVISASHNGKTYYGFKYPIDAFMMADTITAEFHYIGGYKARDGLTLSQDYSAIQYMDSVLDGDYSEEAKDLMLALKDYGHYVQELYSDSEGWKIDTEHKAIGFANEITEGVRDTVKSNTKDYKASDDKAVDNISITYRLDFGKTTNLEVYIKATDDFLKYELFQVRVNDNNEYCQRLSDYQYRFTLDNISAHHLSDMHTLKVNIYCDQQWKGERSLIISPLSYVYAVLNDDEAAITDGYNKEKMKDAVTALSQYYNAVTTYGNKGN